MEKETHVGEMLAQCIESEYGVKTEQYFIWEHTDQVPNELLARYLDLLHRNNARFLNFIRSEDGISIIRYVDIRRRNENDDWFFAEYRDIFRNYLHEHDEFSVSVKRKLWGDRTWESIDSIPYICDLTKTYNYICFPSDYVQTVTAICKKYCGENVEIAQVPNIPDWSYTLRKEDDCFARWFVQHSNHNKPVEEILHRNGVPCIEVIDERGKIRIVTTSYDDYKSQRHNIGFRIDLNHALRSSWEANIARLLRTKHIPYEYEREMFDLGEELCYTQDFFLPNSVIVEVKGYWGSESRKKVMLLQKNHPELTVLPLDSDMYYTIQSKYSGQIAGWEGNEKAKLVVETVSIVGMKFCASKDTLKNLTVGDSLILEREPENKYDKNAILVKNSCGFPVGHISGDWAAVYAPKMDAGMTYHAEIVEIQPSSIHAKVRRENIHAEILYAFLK